LKKRKKERKKEGTEGGRKGGREEGKKEERKEREKCQGSFFSSKAVMPYWLYCAGIFVVVRCN
jgi:hypothetical protein